MFDNQKFDAEIIRALVTKYDRSGPRYTSYPTAPIWNDEYGINDYGNALSDGAKLKDNPLSVYLHIPFCRKLCWFCGCNKVISSNQEKAASYLDYVEKEITTAASLLNKRNRVTQLHWGGGTPSLMNLENTQRAFKLVADHFDITPDAEVAIEIDPRTTDHDKIDLLKSLGFNRLSFGVQDFNIDVQNAIGREQLEETTVDLYQYSRKLGFTGINLDLIYGLPKQTVATFRETITKIIQLRPDRIAMYSFAHIPSTIPGQKLMNPQTIPATDDKLSMFLDAQKQFIEAGYMQVGMDHFVLPEDDLGEAIAASKLRRNFMGYTVKSAADWIGFGMSSISYINNQFIQNYRQIKDYYKSVSTSGFGVHRGLKLSKDDLIRQQVISALMCNFRVDFSLVNNDFDIAFTHYFENELNCLRPFENDNLVKVTQSEITVSSLGRNVIRNIAMIFDAYLSGEQKVNYSRTI